MKWFRLYTEARNDAKLRSLSDAQFRVWFNLLCFASEQKENRGIIAGYNEELLAVEVAECDVELLRETLGNLEQLRIIEKDGDIITFVNFSKRQYDKPSDRPEEVRKRVQRHRRQINKAQVTPCNADETPCNDTDPDTDPDTDLKDNTLSTPCREVDPPPLDAAPDTEGPKEEPKVTKTPYQDIVDLYLKTCPSLPRVRVLTDKRRQQMRARWKRYPDIKTFQEVFAKAQLSDFLSGRNGKWTSCNLDWLLNENNMVKVLEGNYDNRDPVPKRSPPSHLTVADVRKQRGGGAGGAGRPTAQGP